VSVGLEPACIKACPTGCLSFGTKENLLLKAQKRVDQLKASGFTTAGIYDPDGVGGTGVVTILAYSDKPEMYGLPADPTVPWTVSLWKVPLKWIGNLAILGGIIGTFLHYLRYGPKHVPEDKAKQAPATGGPQ
jgi:formate dehydrogenase iron-sulfur subunit